MLDIAKPYTDPQKVEECMALVGAGYNPRKISAMTGVPYRTIHQWINAPTLAAKYAPIIKAARERLAYRWSLLADQALDELEEAPRITDVMQPVAIMTGWGIATDKVQKDAALQEPPQDNRGPFVVFMPGSVTIQSNTPVAIDAIVKDVTE